MHVEWKDTMHQRKPSIIVHAPCTMHMTLNTPALAPCTQHRAPPLSFPHRDRHAYARHDW